MSALKGVEKVQLVLPPPRRPDTYIARFEGRLSRLPGRRVRQGMFQLAEAALSRDLLAAMLGYLIRLPPPGAEILKYARWPQPLGILSLGTYLRQNNPGVEVELLDGNNVLALEEVKRRIDADLVGISATALGYDTAIEVARVAKRRGATVVLGGAAATPLAREILTYHPFVDAVIRYDGERALSKLVAGAPWASIENLVYRRRPSVGGPTVGPPEIVENPVQWPSLDALPAPDRDLLDMEVYFRNSKDPGYPICEPFQRPMNIYSQKGCIWRAQEGGGCVFCSIPDRDLRLRSPKLVWAEIASLVERYGADFIWDACDNLVGDREWFRAFCAARPRALKVHYTNYVDAKAVDEEVARLLAESGCVSVFVGIETGDPRMLESMNKRSTLEDNLRAMALLREYQIGVIAGVVVGVQGESRESLARTVEFLKRLAEYDNLDRFEWGTLIPFPGSPANRMLREHPALVEKYREFGNANYLLQLVCMIRDWHRLYCEVDFLDILEWQDQVAHAGLVPYEMTMFQRRSWSGTPGVVFRV
jgi:radical SAM superfamily enzyme YgiQ (UPF0313 family)